MFELSKQFRFEAAHTLNRAIETESSLRIHGHSYRAEVTVSGNPHPTTGMVVDLGQLERALENTRVRLDHRLLDEVDGLGAATLENLCSWIWRQLVPDLVNIKRVGVFRDSSGDACIYDGS
jgi:6-pyruvoyltetrahydropterin/6-carboxytetrahydropterin synthase